MENGYSLRTLLIRGIAPALSGFVIAGTLVDPSLTIYRHSKIISINEGLANGAAIATVAIQTVAFVVFKRKKRRGGGDHA